MIPDPDPTAREREILNRAGDTRRPDFLRFARAYARRRVARDLDGLWVAGLDDVRTALTQRPLLFAANHVAWWDALLLLNLDEALGSLGWAVMDARNLRTLPFLGWVGALPLDRSSPQRSRECLEASADLLDRPGRAVWIFPQGHQRPAHLRPLNLKHGVETMHRRRPVDVVAVSIDYVFLERNRPAAVVCFSAPTPASVASGEALLPAIEAALLDGLATIDGAVAAATDERRARTHPGDPLPGFDALVRPRRRTIWEGIGGRALVALDRGRRHGR